MLRSIPLYEHITFYLAILWSLDFWVVLWFLLHNTFLWGKYSEMELLAFEYVHVYTLQRSYQVAFQSRKVSSAKSKSIISSRYFPCLIFLDVNILGDVIGGKG